LLSGVLYGFLGDMTGAIKELRQINRASRTEESTDNIALAIKGLTSGDIDVRGSSELSEFGDEL